jgi:transcriptional regulator with GAF, ATPase, and Fis domain
MITSDQLIRFFPHPLSTAEKPWLFSAADMKEIATNPNPVFVINRPDDDPITRHLLRALEKPLSSILGIRLIVEGQFAGAVILAALGNDRFSEDHATLFATLKEPFFVAMSNALKHREVLKLKDLLADDNRYLHGEIRGLSGDEIVGANFGLRQVMSRVQQVATTGSPVSILGETGTGKDMIAQAIHNSSPRSSGPFVSINCGAIPDSLIDSELFGHEKGVFTRALSQKRGRFERAMIIHRGGPLRFDDLGPSSVGPVHPADSDPRNETLELDALVKRHIQHVLN